MKRWLKGATDKLLFSDSDRRVVIRKNEYLRRWAFDLAPACAGIYCGRRISYIEFCTLTYSSTHLQY